MGVGTLHFSQICRRTAQPSEHVSQNLRTILRDSQHFATQRWHAEQAVRLFQPRTLLFMFFGMAEYDSGTMEHWQHVDLLSPRHGTLLRNQSSVISQEFKILIRKGIPLSLIQKVLLIIFKKKYEPNESNYQITLRVVFNDLVPRQFKKVPIFDQELFLQGIKLSHLNKNGLAALSRIMWCLRKRYLQLEYSPLIAKTVALMLIFMTQAQTFAVIDFMVKDSIEILRKQGDAALHLRWFFTTNKQQFRRLGRTFFDSVSKLSKTFSILRFNFQRLGLDQIQLFQNIISNCFIGYLPFRVMFKIWLTFLNEGTKILFRMAFAILRKHHQKISTLNTPDAIIQTLRKVSLNMTNQDANDMLNKGFQLKLTQLDQFSQLVYVDSEIKKKTVFYFPIIDKPSQLVSSIDLQTVWDWLPTAYKSRNPKLIWNSAVNGYNLSAMIRAAQPYTDYSALLFVQDNKGGLFGGFCSDMVQYHQQTYIGDNDSFVFQIRPTQRAFKCTGMNESHLKCSDQQLSFGMGGSGCALSLDKSMQKGSSFQCQSYFNSPLHVGQSPRFEVRAVELYYLS